MTVTGIFFLFLMHIIFHFFSIIFSLKYFYLIHRVYSIYSRSPLDVMDRNQFHHSPWLSDHGNN